MYSFIGISSFKAIGLLEAILDLSAVDSAVSLQNLKIPDIRMFYLIFPELHLAEFCSDIPGVQV